MKIAISGKGGVGKTTISASLIKKFANNGYKIFAVDADPDISLGSVLGLQEEKLIDLPPLVDMKDLITEKLGGEGAYYSLNPNVDDVMERFAISYGNINLLKMGAVKKGGSACYCRENTFLNALLKSLVVSNKEIVVLDMGAGIEHLTRGTAKGVDVMLIVTEPTKVSLATAKVIARLSREIGVKDVYFIANKLRHQQDLEFLKENLVGEEIIGSVAFSELVLDMAMGKEINTIPAFDAGIDKIYDQLLTRI